jgi:hypothetical protein
MSKVVFSWSSVKSKSMKTVPRLLIAAAIMFAPVALVGKHASLPASMLSYENLLRITTAVHSTDAIPSTVRLYSATGLENFGVSQTVFELAMKGFDKLMRSGNISTDSILTIVDFSKSSREKRMVVIDLKKQDVLFHTVVAHGRNTGAEYAQRFSNLPRSHQSSLGFYITRGTYHGSNGYSLKLDGVEKGFNNLAMARAIVMHAAGYANEEVIRQKGYLGRSFGCPAVPQRLNKPIIDRIKNGNVMFLYYPDNKYLNGSQLLNG